MPLQTAPLTAHDQRLLLSNLRALNARLYGPAGDLLTLHGRAKRLGVHAAEDKLADAADLLDRVRKLVDEAEGLVEQLEVGR